MFVSPSCSIWGHMTTNLTKLMERLSGSKVCPYSTYDYGRAKDPNNYSVILTHEQASKFLDDLRPSLPAGFVAFLGTRRWYGDEQHAGTEVSVGTGNSQFD